MPLGTKVGLDPGDIVLDRDWSPRLKNAAQQPSHFSAYVYCGQMAGSIRVPLGTKVSLTQATLYQIGTQLPSQKGHSPQFSAHVFCGQTAGWIKMSLGTEVGLGPWNFVLDGDPAPPKGHSPPVFNPSLCGQMVAHLSFC